ncbi:redoxin domain-containing protein [Streptomyces sp. NPDC001817]|uniref:redoxin domain-containing protein n=1 Tax=Streptomyces sp. NPDC001817 TaxID=3154398 RepID=UPI0033333F20
MSSVKRRTPWTRGSPSARRYPAICGCREPTAARTTRWPPPPTVLFAHPAAGVPGLPAGLAGPPVPGSAGCILENRQFRAAWPQFEAAGIAVHGVSAQTPEEQAAFARAEGLPFPLLSAARLQLTAGLRLPTFRAGQDLRIKRPVLVIGPDRTVRRTLFPITDIPVAVAQALTLAVATTGEAPA